MGNGYTRQSAAEIVDENTIFAAHFNDEFNQLEAAFSGISGHSHDGTLGEGPPISLTTSVVGTLPVVNGGTGVTSIEALKTALSLGTLSSKNGPGTTVDNTITRFDGTTGNLQSSLVTISDTGVITVPGVVINGLATAVGPTDAVPFSQIGTIIEGLEEDFSEAIDDLQDQINNLDYSVGDFKDSVRDLGANWLRRDGKLYLRADYPDLADVMPPLPDGVMWETSTSGVAANGVGIAYGKGRYVGIAAQGNIIGSVDGRDWSLRASFPQTDAAFQSVAFGNGIFLVADLIGERVYVSPDGEDWSAGAVLPEPAQGVAYLPDVSLFAVSGFNGFVATSDDGVSWTTRTTGTTAFIESIFALNGRFVGVGSGGTVIYSTDGIAWTVATMPGGYTNGLKGAAYANGVYVVVGNNGAIFTSSNLSAWTARSSGVTSNLHSVAGSSVGFVAVGTSGVVRISTNGVSWAASPLGTTAILRHVTVAHDDPARYIVLGPPQTVYNGLRTQPTQFRVPNDDPTYGWIKAKTT